MEELIEQQFKIIPDVLKDYFQSDELFDDIDKVLRDQPLQDTQKDAFTIEAMLVLLCLESIDMFTVNIKHGMEIAIMRAEDISRKAKKIMFLPRQEYLVQHVSEISNAEGNSAGDGVVQQPQEKNSAYNEVSAPQKPLIVPAPTEITPTAKESVLQTPKMPEGESLDIFKKRLQQPVHAPVEKNKVVEDERPIVNTNPSSRETIASDPYKEPVD